MTNEHHHLIWPGERWIDVGFARVPWLESGPAFFWIFRPTAAGFPLAGVLALVVNVAFVSPTAPGIDLTPVTVVVVVTAFAWSTFQFGLLDVMPVARSLLLEQLDDGVIVLDAERRVVDLNPAAERLLERERWVPGTAVEQIVPFWNDVKDVIRTGDKQVIEAAPGIGYMVFGVVYTIIAVGGSSGAAYLLSQRKDALT